MSDGVYFPSSAPMPKTVYITDNKGNILGAEVQDETRGRTIQYDTRNQTCPSPASFIKEMLAHKQPSQPIHVYHPTTQGASAATWGLAAIGLLGAPFTKGISLILAAPLLGGCSKVDCTNGKEVHYPKDIDPVITTLSGKVLASPTEGDVKNGLIYTWHIKSTDPNRALFSNCTGMSHDEGGNALIYAMCNFDSKFGGSVKVEPDNEGGFYLQMTFKDGDVPRNAIECLVSWYNPNSGDWLPKDSAIDGDPRIKLYGKTIQSGSSSEDKFKPLTGAISFYPKGADPKTWKETTALAHGTDLTFDLEAVSQIDSKNLLEVTLYFRTNQSSKMTLTNRKSDSGRPIYSVTVPAERWGTKIYAYVKEKVKDPISGQITEYNQLVENFQPPNVELPETPTPKGSISGPYSGKIGQDIMFSVLEPDTNFTYTWDWGDKSKTDTGTSVKHKYSETGTFEVRLTIKHIDSTKYPNVKKVVTQNVSITKADVNPSVIYVDAPIVKRTNEEFTLSIKSPDANLIYTWHLGDAKVANVATKVAIGSSISKVSYPDSGPKVIQLVVTSKLDTTYLVNVSHTLTVVSPDDPQVSATLTPNSGQAINNTFSTKLEAIQAYVDNKSNPQNKVEYLKVWWFDPGVMTPTFEYVYLDPTTGKFEKTHQYSISTGSAASIYPLIEVVDTNKSVTKFYMTINVY